MKMFVSYTTKGKHVDIHYLTEVYKCLNSFGSVFIDLLHNDSKKPQERIEKEIASSDILIVINTQNLPDSEWVNFELETANRFGIKIVFVAKDELLNNHFVDKYLSIYKS